MTVSGWSAIERCESTLTISNKNTQLRRETKTGWLGGIYESIVPRCIAVFSFVHVSLLALSLAASAEAQLASSTEGAIVGTVTDTSQSRRAWRNVQVTLSGTQVMGMKTTLRLIRTAYIASPL